MTERAEAEVPSFGWGDLDAEAKAATELASMVVGVVGLGLVGGSIAKAWSRRGGRTIGWSRSPETRQLAESEGVDVVASAAEVAAAADVVVLATPLSILTSSLDSIVAAVEARSEAPTITDVGSVKAPIAAHACRVLSDPSIFVPGHPMAGTEHAGWLRASATLFDDRTWALSVEEPVDLARWTTVAWLVQAIGAQVVPVESAAHDDAVALISHLPYVLAGGLTSLVTQEPTGLAAALAAGSYHGATRVVAGDGRLLGAELSLANAAALLPRIEALQGWLSTFSRSLSAGDRAQIERAFRAGADAPDETVRAFLDTLDPTLRPLDRTSLLAAAHEGRHIAVEASGRWFGVGGRAPASGGWITAGGSA